METKSEINRVLGLPRDARPEEIEGRCQALLDWLSSTNTPRELQGWASGQRTLVQEILERLSLPEEEATPPQRPAPAPTKPAGAEPAGPRRTFSSILSRPLAMVAMGVILGLAIVGILWWRGVIFPPGEAAQALAAKEAVNPSQFFASSQGRIKELEEVVAKTPQDAAAIFELGETYIMSEKWEEAIVWFTRLLEIEPNNVHARIDIGTANMNLNRYNEAETAFRQALLLEPDNVQCHYNLGFLFAFRRDAPNLGEAVRHWQEVLRLAPNSDLAKVAQVHIEQLQPAGNRPGEKQ